MASRQTRNLLKVVLLVLLGLLVVRLLWGLFALPLLGTAGMGPGGMYGGFGGEMLGTGLGFLVFGLLMLLFWLAVLVGAGYLVYRLVVADSGSSDDRAMEALRLAYARGDIDDEEFEERRRRLREER